MSQIEYHLNQASSWWRWQLFLRRTANLATTVTIAILLLGAAIWAGWIGSQAVAAIVLVVLTLGALIAWVVLAVTSVDTHLDRTQSAYAVEQSHRPLMDRLNTLVFLEGKRDQTSASMARAIERQARQVLDDRPSGCPHSWRSTYRRFAVFVLCLLGTILFYGLVHPWHYLDRNAADGSELAAENLEDLQIPEFGEDAEQTSEVNAEEPWGELRISEPGRDLQVTRLDVVPLQIEAGSTRPLVEVSWSTAANGGEETRHELAVPEDPRYAVFRPEILPEAFQLNEWDVLSYHAQAASEDGRKYLSEIYFLQVLPFRDELEKLPGGPDGLPYRVLEQLTGMIERQQEVMRQTRRLPLLPNQKPEDQKKRYEALSAEEENLGQTTKHLSAELDSRIDASAVDAMREPLLRAGATLMDAAALLNDSATTKANDQENAALRDLAAARKQWYEFVQNNPQVFLPAAEDLALREERPEQDDQRQQGEIAAPPARDLQRDVESANLAEAKTLEESLALNIQQYAALEQQPGEATPQELEQMTGETGQLVDRLREFAERQATPTDDSKQPESALRKALTDETKQQLARECGKLCQQQGASERQETAGGIKRELEQIAKALRADTIGRNADLNHARLAEKMQRMDESRQQMEAARQFVQKSLLEQRTIERQANPRSTQNFPQLAERQDKLEKSFEEYTKQNPLSFCDNPSECSGAQSAMQAAGRSLKLGAKEARQQAGAAGDQLQQLDDALERRQRQDDLADAYRLKRMLDELISELQQFEQNPAAFSSARCQQAGAQSKSLTDQLQRLAETDALKETFGPELDGTLSDENKQQLDSQSEGLGQAKTARQAQAASQQLRQGLEKVAAAFPGAKPGRQPGDQPGDSLRTAGQQAIAQGLRQLESAAKRRADSRPAGQQAASRLQQSAMENLAAGVIGQYGYNERTRQFLLEMKDRVTEPDFRIDGQEMETLLREIQRLRREVAIDDEPGKRDMELIDVDPSRFPADYRKSIQNYFESLSEQR